MTLTPEQLAQIHQLIDVRMKALRHESDDHLDRALLPQKIVPSETTNDILGTNSDGDAAWDDAGSFGVASEDYVDIELAEKADRIHRHQGVEIDNVPTGDIAATNVQDAIIELDTEKLSTTAAASTYLKLDASNDPITGALLISYASPVLDIQATSGAAEIRIAAKTGNAAGLIYYVEGTPYFGEYGTSTSWGLRDIVNGVYALYVTLGGTVDILPSDSDDTEDAKVSGQTIWHDGNAHARVRSITESDILMAQDMAIEAQREAVDLDALMERKIEFELDQKADVYHHHNDLYTNSARFCAGMYLANSGAPTHTNSGGGQKVGSGGGVSTWTSWFDVRPNGYSAQVDAATNKRIDIRYPGLYLLLGQVTFTAFTAATNMSCIIAVNGASAVEHTGALGAAGGITCGGSIVKALSTGDYVELYAYQNESASEAYLTSAAYFNHIQVIYLAPTTAY